MQQDFKMCVCVCLAGCGGPVTAPSGEIHSPLYPNSYPNNVDCSWVISVEPNHRVFFNFSDLDIEYHTNCSWDYVAVSKSSWNFHFDSTIYELLLSSSHSSVLVLHLSGLYDSM